MSGLVFHSLVSLWPRSYDAPLFILSYVLDAVQLTLKKPTRVSLSFLLFYFPSLFLREKRVLFRLALAIESRSRVYRVFQNADFICHSF